MELGTGIVDKLVLRATPSTILLHAGSKTCRFLLKRKQRSLNKGDHIGALFHRQVEAVDASPFDSVLSRMIF